MKMQIPPPHLAPPTMSQAIPEKYKGHFGGIISIKSLMERAFSRPSLERAKDCSASLGKCAT